MRLATNHPNRKCWLIFVSFYGAFVLLPFVAPLMMYWQADGLGRLIYGVYGFLCHQLPERSLFFFGPKLMYSISEIQAVWQNTDNPLLLRQFIGNPDMGWKVAWSDRMISMYGGIWLAGLIWGLLPRHTRRIPIYVFIVLALPLILDGTTHFISDLSGLTAGFRYTNGWLASLTGDSFASTFYLGDGIGSFNSWMRWVTGLMFSVGLVGWAFPYVEENFNTRIQA